MPDLDVGVGLVARLDAVEEVADMRDGEIAIGGLDRLLRGERGGVLLAISATSGETLAELKLDSPPAWDGMIAAGGRLYLTTVDGVVVCMEEK